MVNLGTEVLGVNCSLSEYVVVTLYIAAMRITRRGSLAEGFEGSRRLRAIQMKLWKKPAKLHRRLRQLGYKGEFKRIKMASWKNAACQQAHMAMPNAWFKEQGLYHPPQLETGQLTLFER